MSAILCLETATTNCSVALSRDGRVTALTEDNSDGYSHAERLHLYIQETLRKAGIGKEELAAVAVSMGPGSYTGLRIGVSTAKGLCFALGIPLLATSTLQTLSMKLSPGSGVVVPALDARRMEVYTAVFDRKHRELEPVQALVLDENSFQQYLEKGPVHFIGSGVDKLKGVIRHPDAVFYEGKHPSAREMAGPAYQRLQSSQNEDLATFEPYYLKDFIGKIEVNKQ